MNRLALTISLALACLAVALPAHAGKGGPVPTATITKATKKDYQIFVGVNWNFGVREGATGVVGYRWTSTNSSENVSGGLIDLTIPFTGATGTLGEVHLKGLTGSRKLQGEFGVGYGFQPGAFLLNGALRAPLVTGGTDYIFGKGWQPYFGLHSLQNPPPATETTTLSCPSGYDVVGNACVPNSPPS